MGAPQNGADDCSSDAESGIAERRPVGFCRAGPSATWPARSSSRGARPAHVWDVSGNEYIDFLLGSGPMLVGHAHPEVKAAVQRAESARLDVLHQQSARRSRSPLRSSTPLPCAEKVRFVSTGTEADLYAMRIARACKKRDKILKFEGGYHGMSDYALMSLAPKRRATSRSRFPIRPAFRARCATRCWSRRYNDLEAVKSLVAQHKDELAAHHRRAVPAPDARRSPGSWKGCAR